MCPIEAIKEELCNVIQYNRPYSTNELESLMMLTLMSHFPVRTIIRHMRPTISLYRNLNINFKRTDGRWKRITE